ncbi:MAG TPA: hypothetical protein VFD89_04910, partial [Clostridia bacterium]|nr:hypothetical protein [Clostridia bacterium]
MVRGIKKYMAFILILALMILTACAGGNGGNSMPADNQDNEHEAEVTPPKNETEDDDQGEGDNEEEELPEEGQETVPSVDLKELGVNELGKIMVLMYHGIGDGEDVWVRTPENFRKDLKTLYDNGYRAIGMKDYIEGN